MKIFEHPNMNNFCCPICGTADDKPVTLIGIRGTEEGNNMQARQYHVSCIELLETSVGGQRILAQVIPDRQKV